MTNEAAKLDMSTRIANLSLLIWWVVRERSQTFDISEPLLLPWSLLTLKQEEKKTIKNLDFCSDRGGLKIRGDATCDVGLVGDVSSLSPMLGSPLLTCASQWLPRDSNRYRFR